MIPQTHPAPKAYYAHLDNEPGILTKLDGEILFMADATGEMTTIEPEHFPFLTTLGQVGLADTQQFMDRLHGGAVGIALTRQEGIA